MGEKYISPTDEELADWEENRQYYFFKDGCDIVMRLISEIRQLREEGEDVHCTLDACVQEREELRSRVAELEQGLREVGIQGMKAINDLVGVPVFSETLQKLMAQQAKEAEEGDGN